MSASLGPLLGLYLVIVSLAMIVHPRHTLAILDEMAASGPWMLFSGMVAVAVGLAIVICGPGVHGGLAHVLVTLIGVAALLKGLGLLLIPGEFVTSLYERGGVRRHFRRWLTAVLAFGLWMLWVSSV